jgi:hypothetical protein
VVPIFGDKKGKLRALEICFFREAALGGVLINGVGEFAAKSRRDLV